MWMELYHNHNCALSDLQRTEFQLRSLGVNQRKWQSKIQRIKHRWDLVTSMIDDWFENTFSVLPCGLGNELRMGQREGMRPFLRGEALSHDITALIVMCWNMLNQHVAAAVHNLACGSNIHR